MTDKPIPIDLVPFAQMLGGSREFLRVWAQQKGQVTCFVNPRALGADPALFGVALVDSTRHAAAAWAKATGLPEQETLVRIWEGIDAERHTPTNDRPLPEAAARKDD